MFQPRPYQVDAIASGVNFFNDRLQSNGIEILPTGSGKSVVIANIAKELQGRVMVLQPSKEILEQNVKKYCSYGFRAGVYSASAGVKQLDKVTFCTIGSVAKKKHIFRDVDAIIMDECHLANPKPVQKATSGQAAKFGQYAELFDYLEHAKVLGLTATPYRLVSGMDGAQLKFITRTRPNIFGRVLYYIQNNVLFDAGHLAQLEYFPIKVVDRTLFSTNSTGAEFSEASVKSVYARVDMPGQTAHYANRILAVRKNLLVFCSLVGEAESVMRRVPGSVLLTGETDTDTRTRILAEFTKGNIRCVVNVGVLTTGFDYPELEAVLIAKSTMSLSWYYQVVGRVMRPHPNKPNGWVVDLGGNIDFFGKIETMKIEQTKTGLFYISNNGKQLTNVPFSKA